MTIYTDDFSEYDKDCLIESIFCNNPDLDLDDITDEDVYDEFLFVNDLNIEDTKDLLDSIDINGQIIAIADLGLWTGRHSGYKYIDTLSDIFTCMEDYNTLSIDQHNNLTLSATHHDGTNYITFRLLKDNLSDTQIENFENKLYNGTATSKDISRYTTSLGKIIKEQIYS